MNKKLIKNIVFVISIFLILQTLQGLNIINRYYAGIIIVCCINIILVTSLNVTCGFLGNLTLGHAGFMAIGAYSSSFITKTLEMDNNIEFIIAIIIGGILSSIFGLIISIPSLRLKGDYLAIITLAFGEAIRNILLNLNFLGGAKGYMGIFRYTTFPIAYILVIITIVVILFIKYSRYGRAILAIREDEIAATSSGINSSKYKMLSYIVSAFFGGIAGALYAHYIGILDPSIFSFNKSIEILVMVVLGGMGNIIGGIISAITLTILPEYLKEFSSYRTFVYALVLIMFMLFKYDPRFVFIKYKIKRKISSIKLLKKEDKGNA